MFLAEMNDAVAILLMLLAVAITGGLSFLFYWLIKRNIIREKEESKTLFNNILKRLISLVQCLYYI